MLKQDVKDGSEKLAQAALDSLTAWPADVPEKAGLVNQATGLVTAIHNAVVPQVTGLDALQVFDVPLNKGSQGLIGSTTATYLYTPYIAWKNKGTGDWVDLNGTPQGNVPFATANIKLGQVGPVTLDVSSLLNKSGPIQVFLRAKATGGTSPTFLFNAKESGLGPTISYDGATAINAFADVELNKSTEAELGGAPTFRVASGSTVAISFPAASVGTKNAVVTLQLLHVYDAGGNVEVYDGTVQPILLAPEVYSLKGDPRIFFETQCFEDAPGYMKALLFGDPAHSFALDTYHQRNIVVDETGSKVLQITFDPAVNRGATTSILFPNQDEATEAAVEFDIRFLPDMETGMTQGFKAAFGWSSATKPDDAYFAGIWGIKPGRTGTLLAGNGGAKSHGDDGWSMRWDAFAPVTPAGHPLYQHVAPMQYVYWPGQTDYYGDPWAWNGAGFTPKLGEWHTITHRARVNTVNPDGTYLKDAELDGYIDSKLALRQRGFYLRTTDKPIISRVPTVNGSTLLTDSQLRIGRVWFNVYHGGVAFPAHRCSFQVRNVRVAKFA